MVIINILGLLYLYLSIFIYAYSIKENRDLDKDPILGLKFLNGYFFCVGTLFALTIFLEAGFERVFFFIPSHLGGFDEEGAWHSAKVSISSMLGFALSFYIMELFEEKYRKKDINKT